MYPMTRSNLSKEALSDPRKFYDQRYANGYMQGWDDVYEICRLYTVRFVLNRMKSEGFNPARILDYGCGEGRYVRELMATFPSANVTGCDISDTAIGIARRSIPEATFIAMDDETADLADESFDLVISIEVLEHVQDIAKSVRELSRLLRPGGRVLVTTPCANRFSCEWVMTALSNGFESTPDGYGRFRIDEPGHLRRLKDRHVRDLFSSSSIKIESIFHRAHVFTPLVESRLIRRLLPIQLRARLALLDWHIFRRLPNGATLLATGRKARTASISRVVALVD
jgi:ubiquinone/menaquinone biosynthesis C-methylase UbiE